MSPGEKLDLKLMEVSGRFFGHEWWGDYCALRCNSYNHFSEPTAACVQGYGGMLEVDLGDPVCPLPVQPAKITAKAGLEWQGCPGGRGMV